MNLLEDYGEPFIRALLTYYRHTDLPGPFHKLDAFRLFDAARAMLFGEARADAGMIREGFTDLVTLLRVHAAR